MAETAEGASARYGTATIDKMAPTVDYVCVHFGPLQGEVDGSEVLLDVHDAAERSPVSDELGACHVAGGGKGEREQILGNTNPALTSHKQTDYSAYRM